MDSPVTFKQFLQEIVNDYDDLPFEDLPEHVQRNLCDAYLRDDETVLSDVLAHVHQTSLANHIADLIDGDCDLFQMAHDIKIAAFPNPELTGLVEAEMEWKWHQESRERKADKAMGWKRDNAILDHIIKTCDANG